METAVRILLKAMSVVEMGALRSVEESAPPYISARCLSSNISRTCVYALDSESVLWARQEGCIFNRRIVLQPIALQRFRTLLCCREGSKA